METRFLRGYDKTRNSVKTIKIGKQGDAIMLGPQQAITNALGVTVFGSAVNRVQPDLVSVRGSVSCLEQEPSDAFSKAKGAAHAVQAYLARLKIAEFGVSRAALSRELQFAQGAQRFAGYRARISFRITFKELDRADEVAEGLVSAGMNEIERISFETTKLKEERAAARRLAVTAAIEKAQNYCSAADIGLGRVLHIEDVNPMAVQGHEARGLNQFPPVPDDGDGGSLDPSLVEITGAVFVTFEIERNDRNEAANP